jgi:hypothetical protein
MATTDIDPLALLSRTRMEAAIAKRRAAERRRKLRVGIPTENSEERIVRGYQRDTRALEAFKRFFGSRRGARFVHEGVVLSLPSGKQLQPFKDDGGSGGERRPRKGR